MEVHLDLKRNETNVMEDGALSASYMWSSRPSNQLRRFLREHRGLGWDAGESIVI